MAQIGQRQIDVKIISGIITSLGCCDDVISFNDIIATT